MKVIFNYLLLFVVAATVLSSCIEKKESVDPLQMAIDMANSEMKRNPEAWMIDFRKTPKWGYTQGLVGSSYQQLTEITGDSSYVKYIKETYLDKMIDENGIIIGYKMSDFNIDKVNSGKLLFDVYDQTNDFRYKSAMDTLRQQMRLHPRTEDGGFWHKKRYTHQMWLDGLYMGTPFLAEYALKNNEPTLFNDVVNQIITVNKYTHDDKTGLNYHAWDESKSQKWADSVTGKSRNFWGRAQGWYAMAIVDVLDFLPENHDGRDQIISILNNMVDAILKVRDPETGMWYQVLDQGSREGNYLEATCSSMFVYTLLKGIRKGYLSRDLEAIAKESYNNLVTEFVKKNDDGTISLIRCCGVAGLGGNPYRDGSYEYYINEMVRDNDPKGVGPFILASLEKYRIDKK